VPLPFGIEGVFAQVFGKVMGDFAQNQTNPLMRSVLTWVSTVQAHAVQRWKPIMESGIRCALRPRGPDGQFKPCKEPAIGACGFCGEPTCLGHAMIDAHANVMCHKCVNVAAQKMGVPMGGVRPNVPPPSDPASDAHEAELREKYLRVLELEEPVSENEIATQFRKLMVKYHPDRQFTEKKKKSAHERAKKISEAYHWLTSSDRKRKVA
jgi:hypothetical protein